MNVSEAVTRRMAIRAFRPDPVPGDVIRDILDLARRAPSGGNLQPWKVYALGGQDLADFKAVIAAKLKAGIKETPEYNVYPPSLWEPLRTRRRQTGALRYAALGVSEKDT
ncbi:MAG: nitroreductase family protein, partial [Rhodospirillaceae bacterium]|nr:nitroreductase family protein [Rhodospirillaceae bacterium]